MDNDQASTFQTERTYDASPEQVWEAITDDKKLGAVFDAEVEFDPTPGAEGTIRFPGDSADTKVLIVDDAEPGERLTLRWASLNEAPTQVVFDLKPFGHGTRLVITERPLHSATMMAASHR